MYKVKLFILASMLSGCAHVDSALKAGQKSLAVVDVATDRAAEEYVSLVTALRAYCSTKPKPMKCEAALYVNEEQTDQVCVPKEDPSLPGPACQSGAARELGDAYGKTAEGLSGMANAWKVLQSQLEAVRAAKKAADAGLVE